MQEFLKVSMVIVSLSLILNILYYLTIKGTKLELFFNPKYYRTSNAKYDHRVNLIIKIFLEDIDGMRTRVISYDGHILRIFIKRTNKHYYFNYNIKEPLYISFLNDENRKYISRDLAYELEQIVKYNNI